jgi:MFS family permease
MVGRVRVEGSDAVGAHTPSLRALFRLGEYRALFVAHVASIAGDQLARVALTVLVFDRTGSAGLSALTYTLTLFPSLIGGPLLSGLADRFPRRSVMVICDVARAALVTVMALPGLSLWLMGGLLVIVQLFSSPFNAGRAATVAAVVQGELYVLASAVTNITYQLAQLVGFGLGGLLVAGIGSRATLLVDAATFVVSALLVWFGIQARPVPATGRGAASTGWIAGLADGFRLVSRDPRLRSLVGLACIAGFYMTAIGLAVPYAAQLGGGAATAGLLMAANPAGQVIGMILLVRRVGTETRMQLLGPLAVGSCAPLLGCFASPGVAVTVGLWLVAGLGAAYQLPANAAFVQAVPDAQRGQAFGLATTALLGSQGVGILFAGLVANHWASSTVVGAAGGAGVIVAVAAAAAWRRARSAPPAFASGVGHAQSLGVDD